MGPWSATRARPISSRLQTGMSAAGPVRGDTAFGSYLMRRFDYGVADSLKFAAALCSIKMETPGPFAGTLEEVLDRMGADHH